METALCLQGFLCLTKDIGIITIVRLWQSVKLMCNHRLRPDIKSKVRDILLSLACPVNTRWLDLPLCPHFVSLVDCNAAIRGCIRPCTGLECFLSEV